jgi:hypothetical protein
LLLILTIFHEFLNFLFKVFESMIFPLPFRCLEFFQNLAKFFIFFFWNVEFKTSFILFWIVLWL